MGDTAREVNGDIFNLTSVKTRKTHFVLRVTCKDNRAVVILTHISEFFFFTLGQMIVRVLPVKNKNFIFVIIQFISDKVKRASDIGDIS